MMPHEEESVQTKIHTERDKAFIIKFFFLWKQMQVKSLKPFSYNGDKTLCIKHISLDTFAKQLSSMATDIVLKCKNGEQNV